MNPVKTRKRVNIILPERTLNLIDRVAESGNRSRLIDEAIRFYIEQMTRSNLRQKLKEGALQRAEPNRKFSDKWFFMEEELWKGQRNK